MRGGRRPGAGAKPRYSARAQTPQQLQERWRFNERWRAYTGSESRHKVGVSPLQVPGSKVWLVAWFRRYVSCWRKPRLFLEAFAGGASVGISLLIDRRIGRLMLVEKDPKYVDVWESILHGDADWLIAQIRALPPRRQVIEDFLTQPATSRRERALHTIVWSWCAHRGRLTSGAGLLPETSWSRDGASIAKAWRPEQVIRNICVLQGLRRRITLHQGCGLEVMAAYAARRDVFWYCDPPYPTVGQRQYVYGTVDLPALLAQCQLAQGPVVVSYADDLQAAALARQLGLNVITKTMRSRINVPQRELLMSNRPLPPAEEP